MVAKKTLVIDQVKAWLFPVLLTTFGTYIWQDIREIKSDVKKLMEYAAHYKYHVITLNTSEGRGLSILQKL
jgi:hypothetical protein